MYISAMQLRDAGFIQKILTILDRTDAAPGKLWLEITDKAFAHNTEDIIARMMELKSHGLRFA